MLSDFIIIWWKKDMSKTNFSVEIKNWVKS